ncbi:MAG: hypothetical protein AB1630_06025 [bacterium]
MKRGKVLLAGVVVGILGSIWGWLTCGWLFNWVYTLEPTNVWKGPEAMTPGFMALANLLGILFAILMALVYALLYKGIPGKGVLKGLCFGLFVWLVGTLPGNVMAGMWSVINPTVICYWVISGLVTNLWQGLVIAAIYGKPKE